MKKIKILFHIDSLNGGGAEKVLRTLVNNMDADRFDITVSTVFYDDASLLLKKDIRYKSMYIKNNKFYNILYRIENKLGLAYHFRLKDDYDIECAYLENGSTKVISTSTNKKAKKLAWIHCDFDVAIKDKPAYIAKTKKTYQKYDKIVCVSEKCKDSFISMFGNKPEVTVVHNVIDEKEILNKANEPLPSDVQKTKITLCTLARFTEPKNLPRLLKTCYRLHNEGFDFVLWLIGDGEQREEAEDFISKNRMQDYVKLFGFVSNPYPHMKIADLLVCSSNYEGYSTFINEGVILGKRILTTDCSGMHEILDNYKNGYIVDNNDEDFYDGLKNQLLCNSDISNNKKRSFAQELTTENERFFERMYKYEKYNQEYTH